MDANAHVDAFLQKCKDDICEYREIHAMATRFNIDANFDTPYWDLLIAIGRKLAPFVTMKQLVDMAVSQIANDRKTTHYVYLAYGALMDGGVMSTKRVIDHDWYQTGKLATAANLQPTNIVDIFIGAVKDCINRNSRTNSIQSLLSFTLGVLGEPYPDTFGKKWIQLGKRIDHPTAYRFIELGCSMRKSMLPICCLTAASIALGGVDKPRCKVTTHLRDLLNKMPKKRKTMQLGDICVEVIEPDDEVKRALEFIRAYEQARSQYI